MEMQLRVGQCRDSLAQLRTQLTAQARLHKYKLVHVRHQVPNTRSRGHLNRVNSKIEIAAAKYRHAFAMLQALDSSGGSEWSSEFRELRRQDVRYLSQAELPDAPTEERAKEIHARTLLNGGATSEGNRTVSWIWRGSLGGGSDGRDGRDEYGEGQLLFSGCECCTLTLLRVEFRLEWSKSYARQARWNEEVILLREEMRRVLEFLKWKSWDWLRKGDRRLISSLTSCPYQLEGLRAYACRQSKVFSSIHNHFCAVWKGLELPREHLTEPIYPINDSLEAMEVDGDDI